MVTHTIRKCGVVVSSYFLIWKNGAIRSKGKYLSFEVVETIRKHQRPTKLAGRMRENTPMSRQRSHFLTIHKYLRIRTIIGVNNMRVAAIRAGQTLPGDGREEIVSHISFCNAQLIDLRRRRSFLIKLQPPNIIAKQHGRELIRLGNVDHKLISGGGVSLPCWRGCALDGLWY